MVDAQSDQGGDDHSGRRDQAGPIQVGDAYAENLCGDPRDPTKMDDHENRRKTECRYEPVDALWQELDR